MRQIILYMKRTYVSKLLLLGFIVLIFSCNKSDDPSGEASEGTAVATVNSVKWQPDTAGINISNGKISFFAKHQDNSSITFLLQGTDKGKYAIELGSSTNVGTFSPANQSTTNPLFANVYGGKNKDQIGGKVEITEINNDEKWMSGNFEVKLSRAIPKDSMVTISSGSFKKVKYYEGTTGNSSSSLSAKIDGQLFTPQLAAGAVSGSTIILSGSTGITKSIGLTLPLTIGTGTFDIGTFGSTYSGSLISGTSYYYSDSGKLSISSHNKSTKTISGTFNFVASDMLGSKKVTVTEGKFTVKYE
jgi:hypothetical protein